MRKAEKKQAGGSGREREISLSLKLNTLIAVIILIVSAVLVTISYDSFSKTAYIPYTEKLLEAEKRLTDSSEDPLSNVVLLYQTTELPGFDEARSETVRTQDPNALNEFLLQYGIEPKTGRLTRVEELMKPVVDEDGNVHMADAIDMMQYWNNLGLGLTYFVSDLGITRIQIVVERETGGYLDLLKMGGSMDSFMGTTILSYGNKTEHAEAVELYLAQKEHKPFFLSVEDRTELVRVTPMERDGLRFYLIFSADVTATEEAQTAFLRRSLLLVGLMTVAAITVMVFLLRRMTVKPLKALTRAATNFAAGGEGVRREEIAELDIRSKDEIGTLYREIRSMQGRIIDSTERITRMTAEKQRISTELELATRIQTDMLPNVFPPFPERKEFDVYALMDPAKEVGGDFYDFFLVDEDHLALVIADVSGKGVPAALFMMISKIMVQDRVKSGLSPAQALRQVNEAILENNSEDMFVTVWLGVLELSTGKLTAANAGHEYPVVMEPGGSFTLFKDPHGFVVGAMPGMKYREYELRLAPGAKLFVYTDGVPEAANEEAELFGTARLQAALNDAAAGTPEQILRQVRAAVDAFVGRAEQFDDLTMLCLEYRGTEERPSRGEA